MSGVIVRRGDDYATTDDGGRFRFTNDPSIKTQRLVIDPRSLPDGWMDAGAPLSEATAKKVKDIGVVPTAGVTMRIAVRHNDSGLDKIDLKAVVVSASDPAGRGYVAQPTQDDAVQEFTDLPPGVYRVAVNPSGAGELKVVDAPATFTVGLQQKKQQYNILLQTQTITIKSFGKATLPASGDQAKPPQGHP